jgi:hypothetical protein
MRAGIFARADTKNNNKRVYPKYILKREVAKYEAAHILRGTALGELDHPNYASQYFKCLNLPNVSHQVLDVEWKGDQLWGTIEILQTPSGLLLWELYSQVSICATVCCKAGRSQQNSSTVIMVLGLHHLCASSAWVTNTVLASSHLPAGH